MDLAPRLRLRQLPHHCVQRMVVPAQGGIAVFEGRIWITQPGDRRDHIVDAGETYWSGPRAEIVAQAMADSKFVELDATGLTGTSLPAGHAGRLNAYELMHATRDMRYREMARHLARAVGAASFLMQATWQRAVRMANRVGHRQAVRTTCVA